MKCRVLKSGKCTITQEYKTSHLGIDLVKEGYMLDDIVAHSSGTVVQVISNCRINTKTDVNNVGNMVKIDHGNGYYTRYLHLAFGSVKVKVGDKVSKGQVLGYMGNTGYSFGGHLHFEVWKGSSRVNPYEYLNSGLPTKQTSEKLSNVEIAKQVIQGIWGNGDVRKKLLSEAGYDYKEIQTLVNTMLSGNIPTKKSNETIAKEVIKGLWGNGADRKNRLTKAGYDYKVIQSIVNRLLK